MVVSLDSESLAGTWRPASERVWEGLVQVSTEAAVQRGLSHKSPGELRGAGSREEERRLRGGLGQGVPLRSIP